MNPIDITWEHSPLWLWLIAFAAILFSYFYYFRSLAFSPTRRLFLGAIRAITLFLTGALLLNPLLKQFKEWRQKPVAVILVDNSASVGLTTAKDSLQLLKEKILKLEDGLKQRGEEVFVLGLDENYQGEVLKSYPAEKSPIGFRLKKLSETFYNQNLSKVILASDGIVNQGLDLSEIQIPYQINGILLGNPNPGLDFSIQQVLTNPVAFLGNNFPVEIQVKGPKNYASPVVVSLFENGILKGTKTTNLNAGGIASITFNLKADAKGIKQLRAEVTAKAEELTNKNNSKSAFIEVIDQQKRILILAAAPHPDLKALQNALKDFGQFAVTTCIAGLDSYKAENYDLVVLHQLPDRIGSFGAQVNQFLKGNQALFLFAGANTDLNKLRSEANSWLQLAGGSNSVEEVTGKMEENFQRFNYEDNQKKILEMLPPVTSLSMNWSIKGNFETVLLKRLGRVALPSPLLGGVFTESSRKAIWWGEGLWQWRMQEFADHNEAVAVDNLIQKMVQLLVSSEKKRQLRLVINKSEFNEGEQARFKAETYNNLFEPIFNQKVEIELSKKGGKKWQFTTTTIPGGSQIETENLEEGSYSYKATSNINGATQTDEGEFFVKTDVLEAQDLEAKHGSMAELAKRHNGRVYFIHQADQILKDTTAANDQISFTDWEENIFNNRWLLLTILVLLSLEWFFRKQAGSL